ncbi:uncharacterized protein V6R79_007215 [Siganus canaliculatus]
MKVFWISCLLVGSITCSPIIRGYRPAAVPAGTQFHPMFYASGLASPRSAKSSDLNDPQSSHSSSSGGHDGHTSEGGSVFNFQYVPRSDSYSGYGSSDDTHARYASYDAAPDESNVGHGGQHPAPVFSDVSDLEPVYSFSSRSRYLRGRAVYAESRYTPGEQGYPFMPEPRYISGSASQGGNAADAAKGTY